MRRDVVSCGCAPVPPAFHRLSIPSQDPICALDSILFTHTTRSFSGQRDQESGVHRRASGRPSDRKNEVSHGQAGHRTTGRYGTVPPIDPSWHPSTGSENQASAISELSPRDDRDGRTYPLRTQCARPTVFRARNSRGLILPGSTSNLQRKSAAAMATGALARLVGRSSTAGACSTGADRLSHICCGPRDRRSTFPHST